MTTLSTLLALLALLALLGGYAGAHHAAGDSLAVFRPWLAGAAILFALPLLLAGPRWLALLVMAPALVALAGVLLPRAIPPEPPGPFAVYQKNLRHDVEHVAEILWDIEATRPDAIMLQEVSAGNEALLRLLGDAYPHQLRCPTGMGIGDTAILSRHPVVPGSERCDLFRASVARVETPEGPLWLVSAHLRWPWPLDQAGQVEALAAALAALDGPKVVGGDFNAVPWSHAVRRLSEALGARPVGPAPATLRLGGVLPLPIDHVLATGPGRVARRPLAGSDHHGLLARVAPFDAWPEAPPWSAEGLSAALSRYLHERG